MSSRSVLFAVVAVLAVAMAVFAMGAADLDASSDDHMPAFAGGTMNGDHVGPTVHPGVPVDVPMPGPFCEPYFDMGPGFPSNGPVMASVHHGPDSKSNPVPPQMVITVPNHDGSSDGERLVEEYEKAYKEKKEFEGKGVSVEVHDSNVYSGLQEELVDAMRKVLDAPVPEDSDEGFLMQVLTVLEAEGSSAAEFVRSVLDARFFGTDAQSELQLPSGRSKDDREEEDDIGSDPVQVEETDEEEPEEPGCPGNHEEGMDSVHAPTFGADALFSVRFDDRGDSVAI